MLYFPPKLLPVAIVLQIIVVITTTGVLGTMGMETYGIGGSGFELRCASITDFT
jgi:hypothetical protein